MAARVLLLSVLITEVLKPACAAGVKGIGGNISGRNVSKPDSSDVGLTKESGLTLEIQPSGHVILGKKGITLSCIAGSNETIFWLHNGIPAPPCGLTRCVLLSNGSLHFYKKQNFQMQKFKEKERNSIVNAKNHNKDEYRCVTLTRFGGLKRSAPTFIQIAEFAHAFKESPENITVQEGEVARLSCLIDSVPFPPNITWQHNETLLSYHNESKYSMIPPGVLYISATKLSDAGSYRCIVTNEFLKKTKKSREAKLTVISRADGNRSHTPSFLFPQTSYNHWLLNGSNLNLACAASGYPSPLITWSFIPRYIDNVTQPRILFNSTNGVAILSLTNVNVSNAGIYLCSSKNIITNDLEIQNITVDILVPPSFIKTPTSQICPNGRTARFECQAQGSPLPQIYWLKDAMNITSNGRRTTYDKENNKIELAISATVPSDSGIYQCVAVNSAGEIWAAGRLQVNTSRNSPAAPTSLKCHAVSPVRILISWEPPKSLPYTSITAYTVHYSSVEGGKEEVSPPEPGNSTSVEVTKLLEPFTNYSFYVRVWNNYGASDQSATILCSTAPSVPKAAPKMKVDIISSTKLNVSWEPLNKKESRGIVVEYKLQWRLHQHPYSRILYLPATIEYYILLDLIPGAQYDLRVLAKTKQGWPNISETQLKWITVTMPSPESNQFTIRNIVDIQVLIVNASIIKMKWKINFKQNDQIESKFDSWQIYCENQDGEKLATILLPQNITEYLFTDLDMNISYTMGLCMVSLGEATGCLTKHIETAQSNANTIQMALEAIPVSPTSINVTWTLSDVHSIDSFELCYHAVHALISFIYCVVEISIADFSANMRRFILLAFIGILLIKNATSSIQSYPSNLAWLFGLNDKQNDIKEATNVCENQECKKIAKVISESMDKSLDPCDDFYEYACGKWPEHNPIPKGSRSWSLFHMLQNNVEQQVDDILKEGPKNSDVLAVKLAKRWYAVCMNTDAMDKQGLDPLVITISRIGGWPLIMDPDEWDEQEYSWQKVDDKYMRLTGNNVFHDVRVNMYNPNKTVKIDTPHLPLNSYKLWIGSLFESEEIEDDDEDPSDEQDNQEFGSEIDDDDNSENNDDDNDSDDDTNEQNENEDINKKMGKRKSTGKFNHKKNKKIQRNRKTRKGIQILKEHSNHKTKKQRVKRRAIPTKIHSRHTQHSIRHEKLRTSKRNRVRKAQDEERSKEALETVSTSTTPQIITEETSKEGKETAQQVYANYISKVARAIAKARGTEVSEEYIEKDIEDMIKFQVKLTEIVMEAEEHDMELTLDEFQEWYDEKEPKTTKSKINWVHKIKELFDEAHVSVDGDLSLDVDSSDYFEALVSLLDETSRRTIVNYIHWNFLSRMIETTTSEMRELYYTWEDWQQWEEEDEEDEKDENDEEENEEKRRSSTCRRKAELHDILAYEYVKRHFSDNITKTAEDMVDDIQKEVEYQIKESDWLDEEIKDHVFGKLVNMKKYIGYPNWYRNNTIVKRYFQGFIIGNSYYENTLSYYRYRKWKQLRELEKNEDDIDTWWMSPLIVNAFFSPWSNSISLSAADFQSPFFAYGRPQAINYGIIGVIMAHEVNHGFDDEGILYDKNGNFVEWLSILSQEYSKRANCFVEQFNNYSIEKNSNRKIKHYGNQTSGENIADTMGLQASYRAYQRRERECGKPDTVLPGLEEITNDQLYFLSFANIWCEATIDSNTTLMHAKMDVHSTGRLRVIGSVSNSQDFAKAFNCPVGSAMNPERKCNIWK